MLCVVVICHEDSRGRPAAFFEVRTPAARERRGGLSIDSRGTTSREACLCECVCVWLGWAVSRLLERAGRRAPVIGVLRAWPSPGSGCFRAEPRRRGCLYFGGRECIVEQL